MHPNKQFPAHFVVHVPFCLHDLFCATRPLHSNCGVGGGRGDDDLGYVPSGVQGYHHAQAIAMQGGRGVVPCLSPLTRCISIAAIPRSHLHHHGAFRFNADRIRGPFRRI